MAEDGNTVEVHDRDADELAKLKADGLVKGKKWARLTEKGKWKRSAALVG